MRRFQERQPGFPGEASFDVLSSAVYSAKLDNEGLKRIPGRLLRDLPGILFDVAYGPRNSFRFPARVQWHLSVGTHRYPPGNPNVKRDSSRNVDRFVSETYGVRYMIVTTIVED